MSSETPERRPLGQESRWTYTNDDVTVTVARHTPGQYNGWTELTEFPVQHNPWLGKIEFHPDPEYTTPYDQAISLKLGLTDLLREMTNKGHTAPEYLYMLIPKNSRSFPYSEVPSFGFRVLDPHSEHGGSNRSLFIVAKTEDVRGKLREAGRL